MVRERLYGVDQTLDQARYDEGLRAHMIRIYNYMLAGLALTGGLAFFVSTSPQLLMLLFGTQLKWVVIFAPLAFALVLSLGIERLSSGMAQTLFWLYCGAMGLSLATIFLVFTGESIARVFFITAATFAGMSLWGYTTRRDLSAMGSFLLMGLIGIILASIVNLFMGSTQLQFLISVIGVVIFTLMTAYKTQLFKELYDQAMTPEVARKISILGAFSLYLTFINLFLMLLHILGTQRQ